MARVRYKCSSGVLLLLLRIYLDKPFVLSSIQPFFGLSGLQRPCRFSTRIPNAICIAKKRSAYGLCINKVYSFVNLPLVGNMYYVRTAQLSTYHMFIIFKESLYYQRIWTEILHKCLRRVMCQIVWSNWNSTRAIINWGLYIFPPIFQFGFYCRAVKIRDL